MALKKNQPTLGQQAMFKWWIKEKVKRQPYLFISYLNTKAKLTILRSHTGKKVQWLEQNIKELEQEIEQLNAIDSKKSYFTNDTRRLYEMKIELYNNKATLNKLKKGPLDKIEDIIDEKTFMQIIYLFNKKARQRMIYEGRSIKMGHRLGYLRMETTMASGLKSNRRSINWHESNKRKAKLIAQGKPLYDAKTGKGHKWLVYYDSPYFVRLMWRRKTILTGFKQANYYAFIPTAGKYKFGSEVARALESDPKLYLKYYKNGGIQRDALKKNNIDIVSDSLNELEDNIVDKKTYVEPQSEQDMFKW